MMGGELTRVLLVEDNARDARLVKELLTLDCPGQFDITTVNRLGKATEILKNDTFHVILMALFLPDADELTTVKTIKELNESVPIVVLSGYECEKKAIEVVQSGAQDYLIKGQGDGHLINRAIRYAIERKRVEQHLVSIAYYDSLTGLPNRILFRERLSRAMIRADRNKTVVALMFLDLDRFKNINDTLGHDSGDTLLIEIGKRLKDCVREGDTVARLGGDEFTVILEDLTHMNDSATVAKGILAALEPAINLDGHDIFVTCSIGITIYPLDDTSAIELLKNADAAMYRAKEQGRNGFQYYTAGMNTRTLERLKLEAELWNALANNEFTLHYQPKVDIKTRKIIGVEALIRWEHKKLGLVSPAEFIPLAEETGLIIPMGEWVIAEACRQLSIWCAAGFDKLRMAVNLSVRQFREANIDRMILKFMHESNIRPENLEIEITESMLMDDTDASHQVLMQLKEYGLHVSIDDFGIGYSSLSYLKRFNIDTLKIDQSFIRDITTNPDDAAIATAIIALGQSLHLNVIAEGVETEEQLEFLSRHGCHQAQGYLFSRPLPEREFTRLLEENAIHCTQDPQVRSA